eukprot:CAMPEP_0113676228 /NCGR_PEP_ID=MMETSP0038_2-20120614/8518_1 /TAXON_ID=2898 /ORGANISM="Cryptomonas paramecium" /LENGTH=957 /DNA_ID=CAMNT_0000593217 /DNA_START=1221 /DNA_END=4094 /DNA_ORIENTATION=- /assembly_acc=CAM_ASM_000170
MAIWVIVVMGTCCPDAVGHVGWFALFAGPMLVVTLFGGIVVLLMETVAALWLWHQRIICSCIVTDDESNPRPKDPRRGFECFRGELKNFLRGSAETNCSESPSGPVCSEEHSKVQLVVNVFGKRFTLHAPLHATVGHVKKAIEAAAGVGEVEAGVLWSIERRLGEEGATLWEEGVRAGAEVELRAEVKGGMQGGSSNEITNIGISLESLRIFCARNAGRIAGKTTKQVCGEIIKPTTLKDKVSYAELCQRDIELGLSFGPANLFVSHAWGYQFEDLVAAVEEYAAEHPRSDGRDYFLWIDIFVVNQHSGISDFVYWSEGFKRALRSISRAVIVLSPWEQPLWVGRSWCLFEFFVMISLKLEYEFVFSEREKGEFVRSLADDGNRFLLIASKIDIAKAEAFSQDDRDRINRMVRDEMGFSALNALVIGSVREFVLETGLKARGGIGEDSNINFHLADLCEDLGLYEKSLELYEEELARRIKRFAPAVSVARTYCNMGVVYQRLGQYEKALEMYQKDLEITIPALGNSHVSVAGTYNNMGNVYESLGQYEKALEMYEKDLEIKIAALGNSHVDVASTYNNMGLVYEALGQLEKALETYEKAFEIFIPALSNSHVFVANTYCNMGNVYQQLGQLDKALETYEKALEIYIAALGNRHVSVASTRGNIANVLQAQGKFDKALEEFEQVLDIFVQNFGNSHVNVATTYNNMGNVYESLGQYEKALEMYQKDLEITIPALGNSHVYVANTKYNMALVMKLTNRIAKARQYFSDAADVYKSAYGADHAETLDALAQAAKCGNGSSSAHDAVLDTAVPAESLEGSRATRERARSKGWAAACASAQVWTSHSTAPSAAQLARPLSTAAAREQTLLFRPATTIVLRLAAAIRVDPPLLRAGFPRLPFKGSFPRLPLLLTGRVTSSRANISLGFPSSPASRRSKGWAAACASAQVWTSHSTAPSAAQLA